MAVTARQIWEGCLTELSKVNAPSMLLLDFNYYINKAVNQYINKKYNIYDVNQQSTDDLRVLKSEARLTPTKTASPNTEWDSWGAGNAKLYGGTYEVALPTDYLHMLNCICVYKLNKRHKCYNAGDHVLFAAKRLTSDSWSTIINDYYNRPKPERPYYYIHNVNKKETSPTNQYNNDYGTDFFNEPNEPVTLYIKYVVINNGEETGFSFTDSEEDNSEYVWDTYIKNNNILDTSKLTAVTLKVEDSSKASGFPRELTLTDLLNNTREADAVEREAGIRYGNTRNVRCEIRYGADNSVFELVGVAIDYIKVPQEIRLTQEQVDLTEDTSQILEYPDSVCHEITNELIHLVMEATADPRLLTHIPVTQTIANPAQQLSQPTAAATQRRAALA